MSDPDKFPDFVKHNNQALSIFHIYTIVDIQTGFKQLLYTGLFMIWKGKNRNWFVLSERVELPTCFKPFA